MLTGDDSQIQAALAKFSGLPGQTAYSIESTPTGYSSVPVSYASNANASLFCSSSFKVFVLAAYLYYAERGKLSNQPPQGQYPSLLDAALAEPLTVNTSDHGVGGAVFGDVVGTTTATAILSAMIAYSDNTATDIAMKRVGVDNVRNFMYETAGLHSPDVRIPNSLKAFYEYLPGHRLINNVETMVCTTSAFLNFYLQTIDGMVYFKHKETQRQFMWFLSMSEAIPLGMPTDTVCYMKGGDANNPDENNPDESEHAAALAGHVTFPGITWSGYANNILPVNFAMLYYWTGEDNLDSGTQAFRKAVQEVFAALKNFAVQGG
jgi:beta-lactamase class A